MTAIDPTPTESARPHLRLVEGESGSSRRTAAKRSLDVTVALIGLLVFAIPMVVIAVAVRCSSRGPVVFTQQRVGVGGDLFPVKKFRTMRDGTHAQVLGDEALSALYRANDYKLPSDDPRITAVGRILRKSSLDELPQLFNVLRGEMSIVGVRPLLADEVVARPANDQALYRSMPPGMTGLWQVEGRSTVRSVDRLVLDRTYLETWSLRLDVAIILRTPLALLRVHHTR